LFKKYFSIEPMTKAFILAPRYRLDDESIWLQGIDPSRHYWIMVNGNCDLEVAIPGLTVSSLEEWKENILKLRSLQPQQTMNITRAAARCIIHCVSSNCYAIEYTLAGALVWHLFDRETIESFLITAHPDWQCAPKDLELGRKLLNHAFAQPAIAKI
jgi:hypothetical protein